MSSVLAFFLSPGRSGTQWITDVLRRDYSDIAEVVHEPVTHNYRPKSTLRTGRFADAIEQSDELRQHLARIETLLQSGRSYIETGWPAFAWIPYFMDKYQPAIRLVHVTRHPVYFALSMETHGFYNPDTRNDGYVQHAQLDPTDPGVLHKEYGDRWNGLSRFEKCLFQWLEIHAYALELHRKHPDVPFLRLRMEDLTASNAAWAEMTHFLGLPARGAKAQAPRRGPVDRYKYRRDAISDPTLIFNHPAVLKLAAEFGYDPYDFDRSEIAGRYQRPWHQRTLKSIGKRIIPKRYQRAVGQMAHRLWDS
ncbi:hypothetical protein [Rhodospirillaceae bacterium SYSU D60014]|uniref:hypothetical protein n=1 Tax=Virgifigura deserti TaxID=2268457 RepID=UPI000E6738E5